MINFPFLLCNRRMQYFLFPQTVIRYGSCDECFTVLSAHALALYPHSSLECQPHSLPIHFYSLLAMAGRLFSLLWVWGWIIVGCFLGNESKVDHIYSTCKFYLPLEQRHRGDQPSFLFAHIII